MCVVPAKMANLLYFLSVTSRRIWRICGIKPRPPAAIPGGKTKICHSSFIEFQTELPGRVSNATDAASLLIPNAVRSFFGMTISKEKTKTIGPRIVCGQCHYSDAQELPMSMELDTALIYLLNSLGMKERDIKQARQIAGILSSIR